MAKQMTSDDLVRIYLKMRAAKAEVMKAAEARAAEIQADMDTVEGLLMGLLHRAGANSMATDSGTFYRETTRKPTVVDWGKYHEWLIKRGDLSGLEKRVNRGFIKEFLEEQSDLPEEKRVLPPGIATYDEQVVRVRVGNK